MAKVIDLSNFTRQESSSSNLSSSFSLDNKKTSSFITSSITQLSNKPTLFQSQLRNHNLRKQIESCHNKIITTFKRKKKELTRLIDATDQDKIRKRQKQNKMTDCCKKLNSANLLPNYQDNLFVKANHPNLSKQFRTNTENSVCKNAYQLCAGGGDGGNQFPGQWVSNRINCREVYLGNILNLQELRVSLSYSRAKFNRKPIKMNREIGKKYYPYYENLPEEQNGVKGIFF